MSINRNILYQKLAAFIDQRYQAPDKTLIKELCRIIIFNNPTANCIYHSPPAAWNNLPRDKSLFFSKPDCGLPIGNLTSQIFANFYLTGFDHYIKKQWGIAFYGRYVDDCIIVHNSQRFLTKLIPQIQAYLQEQLELRLHPQKIYLQPCQHGVKFLGCFIKPSHTVIHHRTIKNFKQALAGYNTLAADHKPGKEERSAFISSVNSYLGILKHYKTYHKRRQVIDRCLAPLWYNHIALGPGLTKILIRGKVHEALLYGGVHKTKE